MGHAVADFDGDGVRRDGVSGDVQLDDGGTRVERLRLVEDEVADAVVDGAAAVGLDGLQRVGVVAHQGVGSGIDEAVGLHALGGNGLGRVFTAPVEADDDGTAGMLALQALDGGRERVDGHLAHTGLGGQVGIVFEGHLHRCEQEHLAGRRREQHGLHGFLHRPSGSNGHHAGAADMLNGRGEALSALIDGVVVGEGQMGDAMTVQRRQPLGFTSKAEAFEDGLANFGGRTFEVGHDDVAGAEKAIDLGSEQMVHSAEVDHLAHAAVEQHVAHKRDDSPFALSLPRGGVQGGGAAVCQATNNQ